MFIDCMAYIPYNMFGGYIVSFTVIAYEKENGEIPVEEFINSLDIKMRAKVYGMLSILQDKGITLLKRQKLLLSQKSTDHQSQQNLSLFSRE